MANKRIRKKHDSYYKDIRARQIIERGISRQIRKQRQLELSIRKAQRVGRASGVFKTSELTKSINYFGEVVQHKTGLFSSELQRLKNEKVNIHNQIYALKQEQKVSRLNERYESIKKREETYMKNLKTVQALKAKQYQQGKLSEADKKRLMRAQGEITDYERMINSPRDTIRRTYDYGRRYVGDDIDSGTYWAAIKKYNELLKEGVVPAISGMDKYESAEWALDYLPYDELMEVIDAAEKKNQELEESNRQLREKMRNDPDMVNFAKIASKMKGF